MSRRARSALRALLSARPERWLPPVQVGVAALAIALAMWGYALRGSEPWWDDLYASVALFLGDTSTLGKEHWLVTVARWLALAVTVSAVVAVALTVVVRRAGDLLSRSRAHDHVVVAGADDAASRIAAGMATDGMRVFLVSAAPGAEEPAPPGVAVVPGDPAASRTLRAARAKRARVVVALMGDDAETTRVALAAARFTGQGRVIGLLRDPVTRAHLQTGIGGGQPVEFLALPEIAARHAVAFMPPFTESSRAAAIVGTGSLAEALSLEIARAAVDPSGYGVPTLHIAGFGADRLSDTPGLAGRVEIVRPQEGRGSIGARLRAAGDESCCYFCPPASLGDALAVVNAAGPGSRALLLLDGAADGLAETLSAMGDERLGVLDVGAGAYGVALFSYGMIEEIARAKHAQYLRDESSRRAMGSDPVMRPWDELGADLQRSNRDFARGVADHLVRAGRRLVVDPTLRPDQEVPPVFEDDEIEELARAEHDRWMRDRIAAGWSYGPIRDNDRRLHPDLRAWDELDEPTRDKDRQPMRALGRILAAAGLRAEGVPSARR